MSKAFQGPDKFDYWDEVQLSEERKCMKMCLDEFCPENGVNLIKLLFIPVSMTENHSSLVSVSLATCE